MADLSPTGVKLVSGPTGWLTAGEAITEGECLYENSADGKAWLAIATSLNAAEAIGIALAAAAADQPIQYAKPGAIVDMGAGTQGLVYFVGGTAGAISPHTDPTTPASTEYSTIATIARANNYHLVVCAKSKAAVA